MFGLFLNTSRMWLGLIAATSRPTLDPTLFFYLIDIRAAVVNMCSRPVFSVCGVVHVKLNFFVCCLALCCNVRTFIIKGVGKLPLKAMEVWRCVRAVQLHSYFTSVRAHMRARPTHTHTRRHAHARAVYNKLVYLLCFILFILFIVNDWHIVTEPTNAQFYYYICHS